MSRTKLVIALVALVLAVGTVGNASWGSRQVQAAGGRPTSYALPGDTVFPEGVTYDQYSGDFFVSSTTDGTIFKGNINDAAAQRWLPGGQDGRTTAVGLKIDGQGRLFIAGGSTGVLFVYNSANGQLIGKFDTGSAPRTFINDVTLTRSGAYFTDSISPYLYRVFQDTSGTFQFERFVDFTGSALVYTPGFNVNGIASSADGRYLIVVQSNTGKLFRVDTASKAVTAIDLGGATVSNGDGLLLEGRTLYVVRNQQGLIVAVQMNSQLTSGRVVRETTDPSFRYPTTIARAGSRLLVVNSQFNRRGENAPPPELPFTVSSVRVP